jgi:hypothetical protein
LFADFAMYYYGNLDFLRQCRVLASTANAVGLKNLHFPSANFRDFYIPFLHHIGFDEYLGFRIDNYFVYWGEGYTNSVVTHCEVLVGAIFPGYSLVHHWR